jgi:hypothetical protein
MSASSCQIVAFPAAARASEVQEAALVIKRLSSGEAEAWWKSRARRMAAELRAAGVDEDEVSHEVADFQSAVFFTLTRLYENDSQSAQAPQ